jgi:hypothetical protein
LRSNFGVGVRGAKCKVHALPQVHEETRKVIEVIENDFTSQSKVAIADKMLMCALARCDPSKRRHHLFLAHGSVKVLGVVQRCAARE